MDLKRSEIKADQVFQHFHQNHQFMLSTVRMVIKCHEKVLLDVKTNDLTYGFGIFKKDNSKVT